MKKVFHLYDFIYPSDVFVCMRLNAFYFLTLLTGSDNHYQQHREWVLKGDAVKHTGVWVHREVRVSLADAVDQFGTASIHTVISVCSCHLDD